jgi:hypothetical protein
MTVDEQGRRVICAGRQVSHLLGLVLFGLNDQDSDPIRRGVDPGSRWVAIGGKSGWQNAVLPPG